MEQFVKDLFQFKVQVFLILIFIKVIKILNWKKKNYVNSDIEKYKESDKEKYLDRIHINFNKY